MRRTPLSRAAAVLCVVLGAAACGGDSDEKSEDELVDDLTEVLQNDPRVEDEEAARCFAEIIVDEAGVDSLNDLDLSASEPPDELQDEMAAAAQRAVEDCGLGGTAG